MIKEVKISDLGSFDRAEVHEIHVKPDENVGLNEKLITLKTAETDIEISSPFVGILKWLVVELGDSVREGDLIAGIEVEEGDIPAEFLEIPDGKSEKDEPALQDVYVPDIGDFKDVNVVEINVAVGDFVHKEQTLITLESDKASMEVPSEYEGEVAEVCLSVGDKVSTGSLIARLRITSSTQKEEKANTLVEQVAEKKEEKTAEEIKRQSTKAVPAAAKEGSAFKFDEESFRKAYASPSVRKFARELGADLGAIEGSGRNGRILIEDVKAFVKNTLTTGHGTVTGSGIPAIPAVDFSQFGEIEETPLSRINVLTGEHMTRCWLNIPHVTQNDWADISDLEDFRKGLKKDADKAGIRITLLAFLMKSVVAGLQAYPRFNSSLTPDGRSLIMKKYYHLGIAVDTPNGLVVPVIRDVNQKGIFALSQELGEISAKAREGKLTPKDMSGGCMTISSLGGIGGTHFTPIVNAPEVAILGVGRSEIRPRWNGDEFQPRLMLPLSLSYDHRVIDGANGARFIRHLAETLEDMRRIML